MSSVRCSANQRLPKRGCMETGGSGPGAGLDPGKVGGWEVLGSGADGGMGGCLELFLGRIEVNCGRPSYGGRIASWRKTLHVGIGVRV